MRPGQHNYYGSSSALLENSSKNGSWWNVRSRLEKWLMFSSSFAVLICTALALTLFVAIPYQSQQSLVRVRKAVAEVDKPVNTPSKSEYDQLETVCLTPGCILIAAEYLKNANLTVDPCDDFYEYACGQYEANAVIADDETSQTAFQTAEDELFHRMRLLLESKPQENENNVFNKVRQFFSACMNKTEINLLNEKPLQKVLDQLGGWPVVDGTRWTSEDEQNFKWTDVVYAARKLGISHNFLVDVSVSLDSKNSSSYILDIDEAPLGMAGRSYLLKGINDSIVQKYLDFMVEISILLGANPETARAELTETVEFEISLANITVPKEERRNFTQMYNRKMLSEVYKLAPYLDWVEYVNKLLVKEEIDGSEQVVISSPQYIANLTNLLNQTSKRTVANYVMWRVSLSVLGMLDDRFRSSWLNYATTVTGQSVDDPRWQICLTTSRSLFGSAVGAMYVRKYLDKDAREIALTLVRDIRREFTEILSQVDWMDDETKSRAIKKGLEMDDMIAYPLELLNDTALEEFYNDVEILENQFFYSTLAIKKVWTDYRYNKLRETHIRNDWRESGSVAVVNAYYSPSQNLIMFPAGILQGIFFGSDRPNYVNYGAIGFVIGHEITHGFDDQGRQFDGQGNLLDWWGVETDLKFRNKTKCIIDQYSHYNLTSVNLTINGINTQGENVADNGGVKEAYRAYEKWVANADEEKILPGFNLTTRQSFWMSYANVWCSKTRPEAMILRILTGVHSPQRYRVNGVVSNSREFAKDFNCKSGSKMNPVNKCEVW
ncbi:NEDD8 protease Nep2 [Chamberlinius hualienensis]